MTPPRNTEDGIVAMIPGDEKVRDRRWRDRLFRGSGKAFDKCGPRKVRERVLKKSKTRIQQMSTGDITSPGLPQRLAEQVDRLARNPRTTPYPLIAHLHVIVEEALGERVEDLREEFIADLLRETVSEGPENVASLNAMNAMAAGDEEREKLALQLFVQHAEAEVADQLAAIGKARALLRSMDE